MVVSELMTLLELIQQAQTLTYVPPANKTNLHDFSEEEVFEATLSQMLLNPTVVYGLIMCCKKYPPVKLIIKQSLKRYIGKYKH
jgi:hypothetical protein